MPNSNHVEDSDCLRIWKFFLCLGIFQKFSKAKLCGNFTVVYDFLIYYGVGQPWTLFKNINLPRNTYLIMYYSLFTSDLRWTNWVLDIEFFHVSVTLNFDPCIQKTFIDHLLNAWYFYKMLKDQERQDSSLVLWIFRLEKKAYS